MKDGPPTSLRKVEAASASPSVRSITIELDGDDGGATVVLRTSPNGVDALCSCRRPSCNHLRAALSGLAETVAIADSPDAPQSVSPSSSSYRSLPAARDGWAGSVEAFVRDLQLLIEAMLRAAAGEITAAVDEALRSATQNLASVPSAAAQRVLGRVSASLGERGSAAQTALAITALGELVKAMEGELGDDARAEVTGVSHEIARLDDLDLIEVARQRERGAICWETRLLVDLRTGTLYREEGIAGAGSLSTGVCGRRIATTLATRLLGRDPARLELMHYTLEPAANQATLAQAAGAAVASLEIPVDVRAAALLSVACPRAAWIAPARIDIDRSTGLLHDADGRCLALDAHRDPGAFESLGECLDAGSIARALAGTFQVDVDGVRFAPYAALVETSDQLELVSLTI